VANRSADRLRRYDPINWEISRAAQVLIVVIISFAVLESLPIGVWTGRVVMWLALAIIVTVICRVQRIRYRDLATLVLPAVLLLVLTSFAAERSLQLISTFVIFFGAAAIPFFPRALVVWLGYVAPGYYRSIAADDEATAGAIARAAEDVSEQLGANNDDPTKIADTVAVAREAALGLGVLDPDWERVRVLFLEYLDWYSEVTDVPEPTDEDWAERRRRLEASTDAYRELLKSPPHSIARDISADPRLASDARG
jgi:hypothetical protein